MSAERADVEREVAIVGIQMSQVDDAIRDFSGRLAALGIERDLLQGVKHGLLERLAALKPTEGVTPATASPPPKSPGAASLHDDTVTESDDDTATESDANFAGRTATVNQEPPLLAAAAVGHPSLSPAPMIMHGGVPSTGPVTAPEPSVRAGQKPFAVPQLNGKEEPHWSRSESRDSLADATVAVDGTQQPTTAAAAVSCMPPPTGEQLAAAAPPTAGPANRSTASQVKFAGRRDRNPVRIAWGAVAVVPGAETATQQQPSTGTTRIMPAPGRSPGYDKSFPAAGAAARLHDGIRPLYQDSRIQPATAVEARAWANPTSGRAPTGPPSAVTVTGVRPGGATNVNAAAPYNAPYSQTWIGVDPHMHAMEPVYGGHHQPQHPAMQRIPAGGHGPARQLHPPGFYPQHHLQHHGGAGGLAGGGYHVLPSGQILQSVHRSTHPGMHHVQQMMMSHPGSQQQKHMPYPNGHHLNLAYGNQGPTMPMRHSAAASVPPSPPTDGGGGVRRKGESEPSVPRKARKQDRRSSASGSSVHAKVVKARKPYQRRKQGRAAVDDDDAAAVSKKEKARQFSRESRARKKAYIQSLEDLVAKVAANTASGSNGSSSGTATMRVAQQKHVVGEKPFACSYCSKRFTTLHRVNKHEKTHSDYDQDEEASYECSVCDGLFSWDTLAAHERTHHVQRGKPKAIATEGGYDGRVDADDKTEDDDDSDGDGVEVVSKPRSAKDYHAAQMLLEVQDSSDGNGTTFDDERVRALFHDPVRQLRKMSAKTIPGTTKAKILQVETINSMIRN